MRSTLRLRSAVPLVAAAFALAACGEGTSLPTTVDPVEMQQDIAAFEAGFSSPATESFTGIGFAIDDAIFNSGALLRLPAMMLEEGPAAPAARFRERLRAVSGGEIASAIPVTLLGKTFIYNPSSEEYEVSGLTGAPANGVRFLLYALDEDGFIIAPLAQVGWVDISRTGTGNSLIGRIEVTATGGTKVMDYTAAVGGTANAPTFLVVGFAGTGTSRVDFRLTTGFSAVSGSLAITWQTDVASRNARSRVQLAISGDDYPDITIGAMLRAGVRKVEINGTLTNSGTPQVDEDIFTGNLTVKVGDKVVAIIHVTELEDFVTDPNGGPLGADDEETLLLIYWWFANALTAYFVLLLPLFTVLDLAFL